MGNASGSDEDREAHLAQMMHQYGAMLVGVCTGILHDHALAQDVVQETLVRAYKRMDSLYLR